MAVRPRAARKPYEYGGGTPKRKCGQTIVSKGLSGVRGPLQSAEGGGEGILERVFTFVKDRFAGKIGSQMVN
jgi:hypothetical protein